jgi:molybdopterin synthase catalytic subunit/molybdopterin converting factor small subunit
MMIRVTYHGPAKEWAAATEETMEIDDRSSLRNVVSELCAARPGLRRRADTLRFAVNLEFAELDSIVPAGAELAVIPPVSGGTDGDLVDLVENAIDVEAIRRFLAGGPGAGARGTFEGVVRSESHPMHGGLLRLRYEAHRELALKQMRRLADEAHQRWPLDRVAIVHRAGPVEIGELAVVVAVTGGHRQEAFEANRWLIEALKRDVPIWKQQVWTDAETTWVMPQDDPARAHPDAFDPTDAAALRERDHDESRARTS